MGRAGAPRTAWAATAYGLRMPLLVTQDAPCLTLLNAAIAPQDFKTTLHGRVPQTISPQDGQKVIVSLCDLKFRPGWLQLFSPEAMPRHASPTAYGSTRQGRGHASHDHPMLRLDYSIDGSTCPMMLQFVCISERASCKTTSALHGLLAGYLEGDQPC